MKVAAHPSEVLGTPGGKRYSVRASTEEGESGLSVGTEIPIGQGLESPTASEYRQLARRFREAVYSAVPVGSTVLVVSRGDEELLELEGRRAWHFPRDETGVYAGYHPQDTAAVIAHLEDLGAKGADYLVFPATAFWWLEHYAGLREYLATACTVVAVEEDTCAVFALSDEAAMRAEARATEGERESHRQFERVVESLLPRGVVIAVAGLSEEYAAALSGRQALHFPLTSTSDPEEAVVRLESIHASGAQFFVIPRRAYEWLACQPRLVEHLRDKHRFVTRQEHVCEIYELCDGSDFESDREHPSSEPKTSDIAPDAPRSRRRIRFPRLRRFSRAEE